MSAPRYTPRPGSIAARVIERLEAVGRPQTTRELCVELALLPSVLHDAVAHAVARGAIRRTPSALPSPPATALWSLPAPSDEAEPVRGELVAGATYLTPSGRRCRMLRSVAGGDNAMLVYERPDGSLPLRGDDGFALARANWPMLRPV